MARVALINHTGVDVDRIGRIVESADLPAGDICLLIGDPKLAAELQGVCIARAFTRYAGNLYGLADHLRDPWDCGVVIGSRWADREPEYPAYFAYLLGHELGHAKTVLDNITLTVYEDLILRYIQRASGRDGWRWDDMPHEVRYDQFGKAIAERAIGLGALDKDILAILDCGLSSDRPRLEKLRTLEPDLSLDPLPRELAEFAQPFRSEFIKLWEEDRSTGRLNIAQGLDFEWLWRVHAHACSDDHAAESKSAV